MARNWGNTFASWAKGPQAAETERSENSIRAIREAIAKSDDLNHRDIEVFLQGSYRNRVNVRQNSDVDVGILCHEAFYYDLPANYSAEYFNFYPATYHYHWFKDEVEADSRSTTSVNQLSIAETKHSISKKTQTVSRRMSRLFFDHRRYSDGMAAIKRGVELRPDRRRTGD